MKRVVSARLQGSAFCWVIAFFAALPLCPASAEEATVALLLQQTPYQAGIVTPGLGVYHFEPNAQISLSAIPQSGYQFVYWLGDVVNPRSNTTTAFLDRPKIIIAVFEQTNFDQRVPGEIVVSGSNSATGGGGSYSRGLRSSSVSISTGGGGGIAAPSGGGDSGTPVIPNPPSTVDPPVVIDPPQPPVPEPATVVLLGIGGLALLRNRRNR